MYYLVYYNMKQFFLVAINITRRKDLCAHYWNRGKNYQESRSCEIARPIYIDKNLSCSKHIEEISKKIGLA